MTQSETEKMNRLNHLLDSYGADPEKWPEADRALYSLIATNPALSDRLAEAKAVDLFLNQVAPQSAPAFLMGKVMADAEETLTSPSLRDFLRDLLSPAPIGGLIAAACLGILIGSYSLEFLIQDNLQSYDALTQSGSVSDWFGDLNNG
ncbi:hypothetical protein [Sneathiella limimaris]|uniref:hypothetical protein n=1 Tax=Sneathiella limimaris TaxID=1964213 RepID=UPI00146BDD38|nr:hypothetical protein [Sneathiella limimaris]